MLIRPHLRGIHLLGVGLRRPSQRITPDSFRAFRPRARRDGGGNQEGGAGRAAREDSQPAGSFADARRLTSDETDASAGGDLEMRKHLPPEGRASARPGPVLVAVLWQRFGLTCD